MFRLDIITSEFDLEKSIVLFSDVLVSSDANVEYSLLASSLSLEPNLDFYTT